MVEDFKLRRRLDDVRGAQATEVLADNDNGDVGRLLRLRAILGIVLPLYRRALDAAFHRAVIDGYILGLAEGAGMSADDLRGFDQGSRAKFVAEMRDNLTTRSRVARDPAAMDRFAEGYVETYRGGF